MLPASELLGNECKRLLAVLGGGAGLEVAANNSVDEEAIKSSVKIQTGSCIIYTIPLRHFLLK